MAYHNGPLIQFFGHLVSDPEEIGQSDNRPAGFRVAVNFRRYDSGEGDYQDDTTFYRCTAFRYNAEQSLKLRKGDFVWVSGNFQPREYQTRDHETRMSFDVAVLDLHAYLSLTQRNNDTRGSSNSRRQANDDRGGRDDSRCGNRRDDDRAQSRQSGARYDEMDVDDLPF